MTAETKKKRILVVEDNDDVKNVITVYLKSKGFEVYEAQDGQAGLEMALRVQPDVILLDVLLPKLDGIETLHALRNASMTVNTPVVMMSAVLQTRDLRSETMALNVASFLQKPFQVRQLVEHIQSALRPKKSGRVNHTIQAYHPTVNAENANALTFNAGPPTQAVEKVKRIVCKTEELPQSGGLKQFPLPKILHSVFVGRLTGRLRVANGAVEKRVYFQNGYPVYAESSLPGETLGAYLVDNRKITGQQHGEIQKTMESGGKQYGEVLLQFGYLGPHELFLALEAHLADKIVNAFSWFEGKFLFEPGNAWKEQIVVARMKPGRLILDGILRHWSPEQIRAIKIMRDTNIPFVLPDILYSDIDLSLTTQEERVWQHVRQNISVSQILSNVSDPAQGLQTLFFFYIVGMLGYRITVKGKPIYFEEQKTVAPKNIAVNRGVIEANGRAQELMADYVKFRTADYFAILNVKRNANIEQINRAFSEKKKKYHPDKLAGIKSSLVHAKIEELNMLVHKAYSTLINPTARQKYIRTLDGAQESMMLSPRTRTNKHSLLNFAFINKSEAQRLYEYGFSVLREGNYLEATKAFEAALNEEPKAKFSAYFIWSKYLLNRLSFEDADKELKQLARENDDEPLIPYLQGSMFLRMKRNKEAIAYFEKVLTIDSQHIDAARQLRLIRMRRNSEPSGLFELLKMKK